MVARRISTVERARMRLNSSSLFRIVGFTAAVAFAAIFFYAVGGMLVSLFTAEDSLPTIIERALSTRGVGAALRNSGILLVTAVPLSLIIGSLFAWLTERTDIRLGRIADILPLVPLFIPPIALAVGWVFLASKDAGLLNAGVGKLFELFGSDSRPRWFNIGSWTGLVFVYVLHLVPYVYLVVSAALRNVDSAEDEASRMSGAGPLRTLFRVSFPAIIPAFASAALLAVMTSLALFSIPVVVGSAADVTVLPVLIVNLIQGTYPPKISEAVVLGVFIAVVVGSMWLFQRRLARHARHSTIGGKASTASRVRLGAWRLPARLGVTLYLLATAVLPMAALILVALQPFWSPTINVSAFTLKNFRELFGRVGPARDALLTSGSLAVGGATLGILLAALLVSYGRSAGRRTYNVVDGVTKAPAAISHIVIGIAFIVAFGGAPFYLLGTVGILLIAYLVIYMPQATISAGSANEQIGDELLEASQISGATGGRTFRRISLPLMAPGLTAGWAILFVLMIGDLTASVLLASTRHPVVGFVILNVWENGTFSTLAALGVTISLVSTFVVSVVLVANKRQAVKTY